MPRDADPDTRITAMAARPGADDNAYIVGSSKPIPAPLLILRREVPLCTARVMVSRLFEQMLDVNRRLSSCLLVLKVLPLLHRQH